MRDEVSMCAFGEASIQGSWAGREAGGCSRRVGDDGGAGRRAGGWSVGDRRAYLGENAKLGARHTLALGRAPHAVVRALHQPLLQHDRVADEGIIGRTLRRLRLQAFEQRVEAGVVTLGQQEEQVQAGDLAALAVRVRRRVGGRGQLVEGLQLLVVAGEGVGVLGADGEEGARFEGEAREGEEGGGRAGAGKEGIEMEEGELCFGEQARGLRRVWRGSGEPAEKLLEFGFGGHGVLVGGRRDGWYRSFFGRWVGM
jgi:hypothetical protein